MRARADTARVLAVIGLVVLVLAGCRRDRAVELPQEMFFNVDTTLLGPAHVEADLGFSIRPPREWTPVPDSLLESVAARLATARPFRPWATPHVVAAYEAEAGRALFLVTRFARPVSDAERDTLGDRERAALAAEAPSRSFQETVYLRGGSYVRQFLITGPDRVAFRLLVTPPGATPIRLDYIVQKGLYPRVVKAIESSIGSMTYRP